MSSEFRKAALALVLCTPSSVNDALVTGTPDEVTKLVSALGLKDEWLILKAKLEQQGGIDRQLFNQVSKQSAEWIGDPPHPNDTQVANIVKKILELETKK